MSLYHTLRAYFSVFAFACFVVTSSCFFLNYFECQISKFMPIIRWVFSLFEMNVAWQHEIIRTNMDIVFFARQYMHATRIRSIFTDYHLMFYLWQSRYLCMIKETLAHSTGVIVIVYICTLIYLDYLKTKQQRNRAASKTEIAICVKFRLCNCT